MISLFNQEREIKRERERETERWVEREKEGWREREMIFNTQSIMTVISGRDRERDDF